MLWKITKAGNDPTIDFAAQELYRCLNAMDRNADVAILTYDAYRESVSNTLWLRVCPELANSVKDPALDDAFSVHVTDGAGAICGSNPRSVLFGVYCFLKKLGCTWVRPGTDGEYIESCTAGSDVREIRLDPEEMKAQTEARKIVPKFQLSECIKVEMETLEADPNAPSCPLFG